MEKFDDFHVSYPEIRKNDKALLLQALAIIKEEFDIRNSRMYPLGDDLICEINFRIGNKERTLTMFMEKMNKPDTLEKLLHVYFLGNNHWPVHNKRGLIKRLDMIGVPRKVKENNTFISKYLK